MSASPTRSRAIRTATAVSSVPIAGPPGRPDARGTCGGPRSPPLGVGLVDSLVPRKVWAGSVTLHTVLLRDPGVLVFLAAAQQGCHFDSRLAGSPNGVVEGEMLTGGLNTPLPMPVARRPTPSSPSISSWPSSSWHPRADRHGLRAVKNPGGGGE